MIITLDILPEVLAYATLLGSIYWLLYRHYIFSVADPVFIFVVTTTFASVLVIEAVEDSRNIIHYFVCQLCAWIGFAGIQRYTGNPVLKAPTDGLHFNDMDLLRYTCYLLFSIYLLSNLIILRTKGFALLSDAPSDSKVTNFQEGFGIFRKINWAMGGVASAGLFFLYLLQKKRRDLILLLLVVSFTALEGSKGALLRYAVMAVLFIYHPAFRQQYQFRQQIKKYALLGIIAVFGVFFIVLARENEGSEAVLLAFVRRLLYGADSLLFFITLLMWSISPSILGGTF